MVRLTDRLDMTLDVYTVDVKQQYNKHINSVASLVWLYEADASADI